MGHNYFWFYRDAMEVCLNTGDWDSVEGYAAALEDYTRPEPLPWSDFFIARGRALATYGKGRRDDALIAKLRELVWRGPSRGARAGSAGARGRATRSVSILLVSVSRLGRRHVASPSCLRKVRTTSYRAHLGSVGGHQSAASTQ